ncbi:MAG: AI-2E family transporter [Roseburia sp.]|nr:AI-2E family transporter [Roseburia sp.]MCM1098101.1 AI-2E family transporter [Ruminococcus flavefaciens]
MKFKLNNKYVRWGLTAFLVIAGGIVFYYFMFHRSNIRAGFNVIVDILMPVVVGMSIAYLLTPVLNFIEGKLLRPLCDKCKVKPSKKRNSLIRGVGILVTVFLFVALIYVIISMLVSQIVPSVQNIVSNFDTYTTNFTAWLNKTLEDNPETRNTLLNLVDKYSDELEKWFTDVLPNTMTLIKTVSMSVIGVVQFLWDFVIGFIISIYVLASKEHFAGQSKKIAYALFEQNTANTVIQNFRFTHQTFIGFLGGKIIDSVIIGILCFIGTSIMKTPYSALVSVIIGFTNIIPFFGPFLGAVPSAVLIFVVDPLHPLNCLYFVLFILVLQQFDGNILGPKILGSSTGLTGFWVIFSITLFGGLMGVFGMIIGVPIFAVLYAAVRSGVNILLRKKEMPTDTLPYEKVDYVDAEGGFHELTPKKKEKPGNGGKKGFLGKKSRETETTGGGAMEAGSAAEDEEKSDSRKPEGKNNGEV